MLADAALSQKEFVMFVEYIGVTQEVANLIEAHRRSSTETKSDILLYVLGSVQVNIKKIPEKTLDIGEGAKLRVGEKIFLFLSKRKKEQFSKTGEADGTALVREDGLYVDGLLIPPSKGSSLQPSMRLFQERLDHRNEDGEFVSLSAWRQWHVIRNQTLVPLLELKDLTLAKRRRRKIDGEALLRELDS
jgi:hypothetical protein